ncbi:MAG: hypothetical protein IKO27_02985 [Ruminococcus sp.]|nr:hypothetical protein [Ruminococcus sp.]
MANTKKKASAKKKLFPAAGMLAMSAVMLSAATYAWFTMSREVEVKNIQMTATVPEDVQISIGQIGKTSDSNAVSTKELEGALGNSTGFVMKTGSGTVTAPRENTDYDAIDWSNTVDISKYYGFGKLIPASSTKGEDIIFTPDANGVGKTVDPNAKFYLAADAAVAQTEPSGTGKLNATAFPYESTNKQDGSGTWSGYSQATAWNDTNDDGYYVDIPVWLRTSSKEGVSLKVSAYVKDVANSDAVDPLAEADNATADGEKLYKAVRVAILDKNGASFAGSGTGLLQVGDSAYGSGSVLNWYDRDANNGSGTKTNENKNKALDSVTGTSGVYGTPVKYDGTSTMFTLANGKGTSYGASTQVIVRVWIEGEDPDCWNETAGQDWSINLKFSKVDA